jgi:hypothetical protein
MTPRHLRLLLLAGAGVALGIALRGAGTGPAWPWWAYPVLAAVTALAVPMLLGSAGTGGTYQRVTQLWAVLRAVATVLAAAGLTALAAALAGAGHSPWAPAALALATGLVAGMGLVKLALRKARSPETG